jgi:hypothetical protein
MEPRNVLKCVFAVTVVGLAVVGNSFLAAAAEPPPKETKNQEASPGPTIPLTFGSSIPLAVQSPGAEWRGQPIHLVNLTSIQFDLDKETGRLKADVKAGVLTFDNVAYDVSVAVFDAAGRLLGVSRGRCNVERIMLGKSTIRPQTVSLDFGVSRDYVHAATFMVAISNRKVVTPEEWYKQRNAIMLTPKPIALSVKPKN